MDSVDLNPGGHHLLHSLLPIGELWPLRMELCLIHLCSIHLVALPHCEGSDIREAWDRSVQILRILVSPSTLRVVLLVVILLLVLRVVGGRVITFHFLILTNYNSKAIKLTRLVILFTMIGPSVSQ